MAFNPFAWFRKRQKRFMAALAIMCMVLFIASAGLGRDSDLLGWVLNAIGQPRGRGDRTPVAALHGKTWTVGDLQLLHAQRELAHTFMANALTDEDALTTFRRDATKFQSLTEFEGLSLRRAFENWNARHLGRQSATRTEVLNDLRSVEAARGNFVRDKKEDLARLTGRLQQMLELDLWVLSRSVPESYFGLPLAPEGLLDFVLWRQQADKLGIVLTPADLRAQINAECGSDVLEGNPAEDEKKVRKLVGRVAGANTLTLDTFYTTMADEFRVRLAHQALTGIPPGALAYRRGGIAGSDAPAHLTPAEFWKAFQENRTELSTAIAVVPVEAFVSKVEGKPSEAEIEDLYRRFKAIEPTPDRNLPAFGEPRRVAIEYVTTSPDLPFYAARSAEIVPTLDLLRPFALLSEVNGGGGLLSLWTLGQEMDGLRKLAEEMTKQTDDKKKKELLAGYVATLRPAAEYVEYADRSKVWTKEAEDLKKKQQQHDIGLAVAQTLTAGGLHPPFLAGIAKASLPAPGPERDALTLRSLTASLLGISDVASGPYAALAALSTLPPPPKTLAEVRDRLVTDSKKRHASALMRGRVDEFRKGLEGKNAKDAADYVAKNAVPEQGFAKRVTMSRALDFYDMDKAPELTPLRGPFQALFGLFQRGAPTPNLTAYLFAEGKGLYRPLGDDIFAGGSAILFSGFGSSESTLVWKSQDQKAYTPTLAEARPKVEARWRFEQARLLAKKEAEALLAAVKAKVKEGGNVERFLADEEAKRGWKIIKPATKIAKLVDAPAVSLDKEYTTYRWASSEIEYPRADTVEKLLENLKAPGDGYVFSDRPERLYYAAALVDRTEPTTKDFHDVYARAYAANRFDVKDLLWRHFERDKQEKFLADTLKGLRRDAKAPLDDNDHYSLPDDARKRLEKRTGDVE